MEKEADGWWRGRCGARIGWFPFNYVEEIAQGGGDPTPATLQPSEKSFACGVIALYSFNSGNPEELAFQKGDLMDIIDQPADDPDWWEARLADGTTGLVPRNYVEVVHDAEPVFGAGKPSGGPPRQQAAAAIPSLPQGSRPPPPFAHEPWYHGKVARRDAEALLNTQAQNGQFIVRSSETKVRLLNWKKSCARLVYVASALAVGTFFVLQLFTHPPAFSLAWRLFGIDEGPRPDQALQCKEPSRWSSWHRSTQVRLHG